MINILSIKEQIEIWNDKLNSFTGQFDSPWAGMVIFIGLLAIAVISINAFSSKR